MKLEAYLISKILRVKFYINDLASLDSSNILDLPQVIFIDTITLKSILKIDEFDLLFSQIVRNFREAYSSIEISGINIE